MTSSGVLTMSVGPRFWRQFLWLQAVRASECGWVFSCVDRCHSLLDTVIVCHIKLDLVSNFSTLCVVLGLSNPAASSHPLLGNFLSPVAFCICLRCIMGGAPTWKCVHYFIQECLIQFSSNRSLWQQHCSKEVHCCSEFLYGETNAKDPGDQPHLNEILNCDSGTKKLMCALTAI